MFIDVSANKHKHGIATVQMPMNTPWAVCHEHTNSRGTSWEPIAYFFDEGQARGFAAIFADPTIKVFGRYEGN